MTCYYPLHAFKAKSKDVQKTQITFRRSESWKGERLDLPCGQCIGCRLDRAKMWATRCVHEASLYEKNCFITLTYDDEHLPENGSLCLRDFQLFMKKLRKKYGKGIRYFHAGEYGDGPGARPHYHALLFNHDFSDKKKFSRNNGNWIYTSDELSSLWEKGISSVAELNFKTAGYVARYSLKKVTGKKAEDHYGIMAPEYATMSRRPGIGKEWFTQFSGDVYPHDRVIVDGSHTRPPRYYDGLLGKNDPSTLALLKIKREQKEKFVITDHIDGKDILESDSSDRRLIEKEKTKLGQIDLLKRHKDGV